jgi:hypothetical protein
MASLDVGGEEVGEDDTKERETDVRASLHDGTVSSIGPDRQMKRFLSPQVPLLVFRSDPAATKLQQQQQQQRCGCVAMMKEDQEDREGECGVTTATITPSSTPHACECPTDACYACGLDQGEVEVPIQERGQNCSSSSNNNGGGGRTSPAGHRPFHLFITVCMHGNEKTGTTLPSTPSSHTSDCCPVRAHAGGDVQA